MKRMLCAAILAAALCLCLAAPALAAAVPDPLPPVEPVSGAVPELPDVTAAPSADPSGEASSDEPSAEPSGEASEEPTEEPEEETLPLVPGRYEGEDGGVLIVKEDGACTYETMVSGTVNGRAMSGRLTFHGTVENGEFSFTKVTFFGLDLTRQAEEAGYTDAAHWEQEAAALYAAALAS